MWYSSGRSPYDISSFEEIRRAALRIMRTCVDVTYRPRDNGKGGFLGGVGGYLKYFLPVLESGGQIT